MENSVVEWLVEKLDNNLDINHSWRTRQYIEQAKALEAKQRQEDTNNGYAQGYDDAAQGKEPMRPEIRNAEKQSYQDKMRDKVNKAKSRLK